MSDENGEGRSFWKVLFRMIGTLAISLLVVIIIGFGLIVGVCGFRAFR